MSLMAEKRNTIPLLILITSILLFSSTSSSTTPDYTSALSMSLVYFESQRSGHLPHSQRVHWRSDSGLNDGLDQNVDLVGGYYDAGDHVKFGLPMAFTVTILSWSLISYSNSFVRTTDDHARALEAIKWGTDYLVKAHTAPDVFWGEVGDGDTDHYCWQRPEDMTTSRRAYRIDSDHPGSDLAGETAAAMAAASIVFKNVNPHYSRLLLHHAQQLFEFADKYRGKYDESIRVVKKYYASVSGYGDELLWAALWLYKATDKMEYLNYVVENGLSLGGVSWSITEFSWDVKYAGVQILASQLLDTQGNHSNRDHHTTILNQYKSKAEYYICANLGLNTKSSNVHRTPSGLIYIREWNNLQYVTSAAFLLTVYSDHLNSTKQTLTCPTDDDDDDDGTTTTNTVVSPNDLLIFVKSQIDYILGNNPLNMSYLVGYGNNYPQRVHHRGASIVSYKLDNGFIGCTQGYDYWYGRNQQNPNVLVGAVVGGPDQMDGFVDDRGNYVQTEACTYNTAPLVGVFARLGELDQIRNNNNNNNNNEVTLRDVIGDQNHRLAV